MPATRITPSQIRSARGALRWSAAKLAEASGLSLRTIQSIEAGESDATFRKSSLLAIKAVLEESGVEFIGSPDDAPGIRIHPRPDQMSDD